MLDSILMTNGVIRVGGRFSNSAVVDNQPVIVHPDHVVSKLIVSVSYVVAHCELNGW